MNVRERCLAAVVPAALLVAACAGAQPSQRPGGSAAASTHPTVDTGLDTCASCHAQATPQVEAAWRSSRHGMDLVECLVCHGSTGSDFKARPEPTGCRSCHPVQFASVTRDGTTQSCFACHPAHALKAQGKTSPHRTAQEGRP